MENLTLVIPAKYEATTLPVVLKEIEKLNLNCKEYPQYACRLHQCSWFIPPFSCSTWTFGQCSRFCTVCDVVLPVL